MPKLQSSVEEEEGAFLPRISTRACNLSVKILYFRVSHFHTGRCKGDAVCSMQVQGGPDLASLMRRRSKQRAVDSDDGSQVLFGLRASK